MELISPDRLAEIIGARVQRTSSDLAVLWFQVTGRREEYARSLRQALSEKPIVTIIVRDVRFDNPNSILDDLMQLLSRNRTLVQEEMTAGLESGENRCAVILLARTQLGIPQMTSPAVLPDWFPIQGGQIVTLLIEDLTWTADAPLSGPETNVSEICERLFALEGILIARLKRVHQMSHSKVGALFDAIQRAENETFSGYLVEVENYRASILTPSAFRPSLREGRSLVARLWAIVQASTPEALSRPSKALARALDASEGTKAHESLASILRRPSSGEPQLSHRFARNLLVTLATSCQLITSAAHSDDYGRYPVTLLRSISFDLRRSMAETEATLATLDE